jgi:hypothetical protein
MKIHLRILLGPDRRYSLIKNTVTVCQTYFDTIGILNTGPQLFYNEMREILPDCVDLRHHPDFFDIECARRDLISNVPENDWVLWLDGDETPSPMFLENMRNVVCECERDGINVVTLPWYLHMDGKPEHEYDFFFDTLASRNMDEFLNTNKHYFSPKRFIKNVKDKYVQSNWGAHEMYKLNNERVRYYGYIINHYKSMHDWAQSPIWHLFMNPLVHNLVTSDQIKNVIELDIYKKVVDVKIKHNVYTSAEFINRVVNQDVNFLRDFKIIFNSIDNLNLNLHDQTDLKNIHRMYQFVKTFIEKYNFDFRLNPSYFCGNICCKHKLVQL